MEQLLLESLKIGGPVALLIILGFFERKAVLEKHSAILEEFIGIAQENTKALSTLTELIRNKL